MNEGGLTLECTMSFPKKTEEYRNLQTLQAPMALVYGPMQSRRFGYAIGINPLGEKKICSYDCPYCELGPSDIRMNQIKREILFPELSSIEEQLRVSLRSANENEGEIESLIVSGNGEPTLYPLFSELVEMLNHVKSELAPQAPTYVLSNGAHIDSIKLVQAMDQLDERVIKVDAGNENLFKDVNAPLIRANISKITSGARKLKDCIVQSMFIAGNIDNTRDSDIEEWMEIIGLIQPKKVQIYTLDRVPWASHLKVVEEDRLHIIASKLKRRLQIESEVFF